MALPEKWGGWEEKELDDNKTKNLQANVTNKHGAYHAGRAEGSTAEDQKQQSTWTRWNPYGGLQRTRKHPPYKNDQMNLMTGGETNTFQKNNYKQE